MFKVNKKVCNLGARLMKKDAGLEPGFRFLVRGPILLYVL